MAVVTEDGPAKTVEGILELRTVELVELDCTEGDESDFLLHVNWLLEGRHLFESFDFLLFFFFKVLMFLYVNRWMSLAVKKAKPSFFSRVYRRCIYMY